MTKAQIDLAHTLVSELTMYAKAIDQYGNARISASMRNAASLLQVMVDEAEAPELPLSDEPTSMGGVDRSPSMVWNNSVKGHDDV
jgi:hypothetical protein